MRRLWLFAAFLAVLPGTGTAQVGQFAVPANDWVSLRSRPDPASSTLRAAYPGEMFRVMAMDEHRNWLRVVSQIDRIKGVPMPDTAWVSRSDVLLETSSGQGAEATLDLTLLSVSNGGHPKMIGVDEFLFNPSGIPNSYSVSATWVHASYPEGEFCYNRFGRCARYNRPGRYYIGHESKMDSARYDLLYNRSMHWAHVSVRSDEKIREIRARLYVTRYIYEQHTCYDPVFVGTEVDALADTVLAAGGAYFLSADIEIPSRAIWKSRGKGEASWSRLTLIAEPTVERRSMQRLVQNIVMNWPACY
jgi:hypothetical protein